MPLKPRISHPEIRRRGGLRKRVKESSQGFCASCGKYDSKGEADHILELWRGGADDTSNLQWLCRDCHRRKTTDAVPARAKADRLRATHETMKRRRQIPARAE